MASQATDSVRVDANISDLFFNRDLEAAKLYDTKGGPRMFVGYDDEKLRDEAQMMLESLTRLGVAVPSADDLIADFYDRL